MKSLFAIITIIGCAVAQEACTIKELPEDYSIQWKANGKRYQTDCWNCIRAFLIGDTSLLMSGSTKYIPSARLSLFISGQNIQQKEYIIAGTNSPSADYEAWSESIGEYQTIRSNSGRIKITRIDRARQEMRGEFSFTADDTTSQRSITITEGRFYIKYGTY